jgi:CRP-like cAMP-binding protein
MTEQLALEGWSAIKAQTGSELKTFAPGERLFTQGQSPTHIYHLNEGTVALVVDQGETRVIRELHPGEVICMVATVKSEPCRLSARAVTSVRAEAIPVASFMECVYEHPEHWTFVLRTLAEDNAKAKESLRSIPTE